jgi:hypothetical protein
MGLFKKTSPRRSLLRKSIIGERTLYISRLADTDVITSILLWLLFVVLASAVVSFELIQRTRFGDLMPLTAMVLLISVAAGFKKPCSGLGTGRPVCAVVVRREIRCDG